MARERSIIMSGAMVKALLAGKKTQTRRLIKPQPPSGFWFYELTDDLGYSEAGFVQNELEDPLYYRCPYGKPGDKLWVKETWRHYGNLYKGNKAYALVEYRADGACRQIELKIPLPTRSWWDSGKKPWASPIFMPRWASRITLKVTKIRIQQVQDIGANDIFKEGIDKWEEYEGGRVISVAQARGRFRQLWNSLYAKGDFGWDSNPWVWVIEFKRVVP